MICSSAGAPLIAFDHGAAAKEQHLTVLPSDVGPFDALTDRWLIEALSQMSSNPRVRCAAAAWLDARRTALELGLAEEERPGPGGRDAAARGWHRSAVWTRASPA